MADVQKLVPPIELMGGEEVDAIVKSALDQPKDVIDFIKEIIIMDE